eukprot:COSAG05_NODE_2571_length_2885_cov_55.161522_3_plen_126_part_00
MALGYAWFDSYDSVGYVLTLHIFPPGRCAKPNARSVRQMREAKRTVGQADARSQTHRSVAQMREAKRTGRSRRCAKPNAPGSESVRESSPSDGAVAAPPLDGGTSSSMPPCSPAPEAVSAVIHMM